MNCTLLITQERNDLRMKRERTILYIFICALILVSFSNTVMAEGVVQPSSAIETKIDTDQKAQTISFTLDDAIKLAEEHSYLLKQFYLDQEKLEMQNDDLRSIRTMTDKQLEQYFKVQSMDPTRTKSITDIKTETMILKEVTAEQLNTSVTQMVYQEQMIRLQIKAEVEKAYFSVLELRDQEKNLQTALANMESILKKTEISFKNGLVSKFDLTSAEIEKKKLNNQLEQLKAQRNVAEMGLNQLLGLPLDRHIDLAEPAFQPKEMAFSLAELKEIAFTHRPDYLSQEAAARFAQKMSDIYKKYYTYVTKEAEKVKREKEIDAEKEKLKMDKVKEDIVLQVAQAYSLYQSNVLQWESKQSDVTKAEESYRIALARYENGLSTLDQLLSAKLQLDQARSAEVSGKFEVWKSISQLSQAVGIDLASLGDVDQQ
ncbi:exported hypothetical protein [[Clostridium] ultunense Esp]|nr:exported hypothetical protein [[Clostridium] ultunense Esp]